MPSHRSALVQAAVAVGAACALATGCSAAATAPRAEAGTSRGLPSGIATAGPGASERSSPPADPPTTLAPPPASPAPSSPSRQRAEPFDAAAAHRFVERLVRLGPRDAVSTAYRRAADLVAAELERVGYSVRRQRVVVPAGTSWGVRVPAGTTLNVVADPPGFDPAESHVVLGAHLDTVPQSPGAEDNASGVAVLLQLGRMLQQQPAGLPVRLVVLGGEESRGSGWRWYAFGSRHLVDRLTAPERTAIRAMVSLDRVGRHSSSVPVCHGGRGSDAVARALRATAPVPTKGCVNRASDHVSFERAGVPAARLGSVPYAEYHSAADLPEVVDPRQLRRSASVVWAWLRSL